MRAIAADMGFGDISNIIHEECGAKMGRPDIKRALKLPEYAMEPAQLLQDICSGQLSLAELERRDKKIVDDMLQEEKRSRDRIMAAKASGKGTAHVAAVLQQETRYKWSRALIMRALNEMSVYSTDGRHVCGAVRLFEDIMQVMVTAAAIMFVVVLHWCVRLLKLWQSLVTEADVERAERESLGVTCDVV